MIDPVQVLWSPAGATVPSLGDLALVDVHDGDTPSVRMSVRMLSIDTPEITAISAEGALNVDRKFADLAQWITDRKAPITAALAERVLPKLEKGGTRQFEQGTKAAEFAKQNTAERLTRPNGRKRNLFVRTADAPFDTHHRLLAYLAPNYSAAERKTLTRAQRATFNLDMVVAGWAATFVIYPSIPGELDLPMLLDAAATARTTGRGIWADPLTLPGYEYRCLDLDRLRGVPHFELNIDAQRLPHLEEGVVYGLLPESRCRRGDAIRTRREKRQSKVTAVVGL